MANELAFTGSLTFNKPGVTNQAVGKSVTTELVTVAGTAYNEGTMLVPTSPTALPLGGITSPHLCWITNLDPTNYVTLRNGVSGAVVARWQAGESFPIPLDPTCVPYLQANTAPVQIEFLIISL